MTDQQHPITPPPEMVQQWTSEWMRSEDSRNLIDGRDNFMAARAAQWGADQELEACCEWLTEGWDEIRADKLRAARRPSPKTPSLKEQALALIDSCNDPDNDYLDDNALAIIRRALEQLDD